MVGSRMRRAVCKRRRVSGILNLLAVSITSMSCCSLRGLRGVLREPCVSNALREKLFVSDRSEFPFLAVRIAKGNSETHSSTQGITQDVIS